MVGRAAAAALIFVCGVASAAHAVPAHDAAASAVPIIALPFVDTVVTDGATIESGEQTWACAPVGATVWYRINAIAVPTVISTEGSTHDTVLTAFASSPIGTVLACSDDAIGRQSRISLQPTTEPVYLQVGGWAGATGTLHLRVERAGRISGTVAAPGGAPVEEICISAVTPSHTARRAQTDAAGAFTISDLMPDTYRLQITECVRRQRFAETWHGGTSSDEATPVVVSADNDSGVEIAAQPVAPGTITGLILEPNGAPVHVCITAYWLPIWYQDEGSVAARVWTDAGGRYELTLEPEAYKLLIDDRCGLDTIDEERGVQSGPPIWPGWWSQDEDYWGRTNIYDATPVRLSSGAAVTADARIAPLRSYPDLSFISVEGVDAAQPGEPQRVRITVENAGTARSAATYLFAEICLEENTFSCHTRNMHLAPMDPSSERVIDIPWDGEIHVGRVRLRAGSWWSSRDPFHENNVVEGSAIFTADTPMTTRVCTPDPCPYI